MLTLLHTRGVAWDEQTTTTAANSDSLKCLKYACANGCAIAEDICLQPANNGRTVIVNYLVSIGCKSYPIVPIVEHTYDEYDSYLNNN